MYLARGPRMRRLTLKPCSALPLAGLLLTSLSHAEEPRKVSEPLGLREPSEEVSDESMLPEPALFDDPAGGTDAPFATKPD